MPEATVSSCVAFIVIGQAPEQISTTIIAC